VGGPRDQITLAKKNGTKKYKTARRLAIYDQEARVSKTCSTCVSTKWLQGRGGEKSVTYAYKDKRVVRPQPVARTRGDLQEGGPLKRVFVNEL